jgi:PKHD-type hydroxylase
MIKFYNVPNFFTSEELVKISKIIDEGDWSTAGASDQLERKTNVRDVLHFNSKWIYKDHSFLFDKLLSGVHEANKSYNFNITGIKEISILKYEPGDFYGKHIDMPGHDSDRKISIIIPLSDSRDHEGGEVLFYTSGNPVKIRQEANVATFFPSYIIHEVTEVTKGVRYSLIAWGNGDHFK